MKVSNFWTAALLSSAAAYPSLNSRQSDNHAFIAPKPSDRRCPCPMLNTLANHGYLPRNGLNISMEVLVDGLKNGVNLAEAATRLVGAQALTASTTGDPNTFNLDDVNKHGVIEHDGSLSRNDIYFGDNHSFNKTIWDKTASHFTKPTIDIATAAKARKDRLADAEAANPEFNFGLSEAQASYIETSLYMNVMSNGTGFTGVTDWVKILFAEQRLPIKEGWTRPKNEISVGTILNLVALLAAASL